MTKSVFIGVSSVAYEKGPHGAICVHLSICGLLRLIALSQIHRLSNRPLQALHFSIKSLDYLKARLASRGQFLNHSLLAPLAGRSQFPNDCLLGFERLGVPADQGRDGRDPAGEVECMTMVARRVPDGIRR